MHIDVKSARTGAQRFGQLYSGWKYTTNETHRMPADYEEYTHLLTSKPLNHDNSFFRVSVVQGFWSARILPLRRWLQRVDQQLVEGNFDFLSLLPVNLYLRDQIWIMQRRPDVEDIERETEIVDNDD